LGRLTTHSIRSRLEQAGALAREVGLDMVQAGWRPTVDNYVGRVTKPRILEAVREAKGEASAGLIDHLKKADMANEAERFLDGSGWLPEPLRLVDIASVSADQEGEAGSLPEFLTADDEQDVPADEDRPQFDAAE
jgi:ParB family chromosome partitioning protein